MSDDIQKRLDDLKNRLRDGTGPEPQRGIRGVLRRYRKPVLVISCTIGVITLIILYYLARDFFLKRQNYPERNVLFRSSNVVSVSGSVEEKTESSVDTESITKVYEGGTESKVGTYLFQSSREQREDIEYFNMDNSQKIRIASATKKPEKVQAGLRISGSMNFREQFAEIILDKDSRAPKKYSVYKFIPERGCRETEITIMEDEDGGQELENCLTELRTWPHGWFAGKVFRSGTVLERYTDGAADSGPAGEFMKIIRTLNSAKTKDRDRREEMILKAMDVEQSISRKTVYISYEDGFFDILPQESTIYLGYEPSLRQRLGHALVGTREAIRLRVENFWDLFPGNYWILNRIRFGKGENTVYPFSKYNNGGYILRDKYGEIAKIEIKDFLLFYGQDILYIYYLDLNGDGKAEERIGEVLCRVTHDEKINLETLVGEGKPKQDITFTVNYSFMSPTEDLKKGMEYFRLCGYLESCMPDQINRGFGKHSMLGYINQERSDIMLYTDLTVENMSRVLTQESTLVARYDIIRVLIAAGRDYAEPLAESYGIAEKFSGSFSPSENLKLRFPPELRNLILWILSLGIISGSSFFAVRKYRAGRKGGKKNLSEESA